MNVEGFKVKHIPSGKYSPGGGMGRDVSCFTKTGKVWNKLHHLMSHLRNNASFYMKHGLEMRIITVSLIEHSPINLSVALSEDTLAMEERTRKREIDSRAGQIERFEEKKRQLEQDIQRLKGK